MDPKAAVSVLLSRTLQNVSTLKMTSTGLVASLEALKKTRRTIQGKVQKPESNTSYKFGQRRNRYFEEIKRLVRNSKREISIITSRNGVIRAYMTGFYKEYERAVSRGIPIRMIAEVDPVNLKFAKKFARIMQLRHLNGIHFRLIAADGTNAVLSTTFDDGNVGSKSDTDTYLVFEDTSLASAISFLFERAWNEASVPAVTR